MDEPIITGTESQTIEIRQPSIKDLNEIQKWTLFFSILGFFTIGLLLIIGIVMIAFVKKFFPDQTMSPLIGIGLGALYIVMASTYVVPIVYLFNFSRMTKKAVKEFDSDAMEKALTNLKNHFKFIGILTVLILALYALIAIIGGVAGMFILFNK